MSASWTNFSVGNPSNTGDDEGPQVVTEDIPACASCRKRKLRCSRETPTCSHCLRLAIECVYNPKQKPGLKTGALEALTRRVALLEHVLLDDDGNIRPQYDPDDATTIQHQNEGVQSQRNDSPREVQNRVDEHNFHTTPTATDHLNGSLRGDEVQSNNSLEVNPRKRKLDQSFLASSLLALDDIDIPGHLPSQPLLRKLADYFCISFHHWIPYLHKQRLQDSVYHGPRHGSLDLVYHAVVAATLRHMDQDALFLDEDQIVQQTRVSRYIVETFAMRSVTLESLRALIIIVFDYLNDGQAQKAWPLIGSLTRTVDYLQLTVEPSASQYGALMNPLRLVPPTDDWTELEERRRLFWVIFLLDRFCSVSTSWNTSLTSEDVHRRLPADGGYFTREEPVTTPYFGIWNKSAARIGRSLAHVPAQYNEDDPAVEQVQGASPGSANGLIDASKLGAFAYCIEATESLSQVTTFFLQQRINWQDKEHAVSWLTRFKELDLRLVQWKLFLPPRWKDSNISSDTEVVNMDPNLTLAHITHNTSMILLHHSIAYPAKGWNDYVALPKDCSAQTCELAAVETSNIVEKFLVHTDIPFVNVQFAFCAFVAAKTLLYEHHATRKAIRPEFERLVRNLWDMSRRWTEAPRLTDPSKQVNRSCSQAGIYAQHLEYLHDACRQDSRFRFELYDHSCLRPDQQLPTSPFYTTTPQASGNVTRQPAHVQRANSINSSYSPLSPRRVPPNVTTGTSPVEHRHQAGPVQAPNANAQSPAAIASTAMGPPPVPHILGQNPNMYPIANSVGTPGPTNAQFQRMNGTPNNHQTVQDQSLLNLSDTFMDSHFLDMDRVITFEDANFFLPGDAFRWQ